MFYSFDNIRKENRFFEMFYPLNSLSMYKEIFILYFI